MSKFDEHMEIVPDWAPLDPRGTFLSLAIAGEAGELANNFKKEWRDGVDPTRVEKIIQELADVGAYSFMLASHLKIDFVAEVEKSFMKFETRAEYPILLQRVREFRARLGR